MTTDPAYLTAALVRLTRLRPRRVDAAGPVRATAALLDELVADDALVRVPALAAVAATHAWRLRIDWDGGRRELAAVDGETGVHLAEPGADVLVPVSNTGVYRIFSTALPSEALAG